MSDIKKGDQVLLNSGGPIMTVQDIGDYAMSDGIENGAKCVWFDGSKPLDKVFDVEAIKIYREEE
jgi:uncharacterized protein YodC (DUF2158 family)